MGNYMRENKLSVLKANAVGAVAFMAIGWLFWSAGGASIAQTQPDLQLPTSASAQPPPVALPPGVDDVVKLAHSGIGDEVILAKIKNDGASYNLTSDQIIYLNKVGGPSECPGRAAPRQVQQHHCYRGAARCSR